MTINREVLRSGAIIKLQLPKKLNKKVINLADGGVLHYLQYPLMLPGGMINVHVHSSDCELATKTIRAEARITSKTEESGNQYLYIDLVLVGKDVAPTHRLVALRGDFPAKSHWETFDVPQATGFVALIEANEKIEQDDGMGKHPDTVGYEHKKAA